MVLPVRPDGVVVDLEQELKLVVDRIVHAIDVLVIRLAKSPIADRVAAARIPTAGPGKAVVVACAGKS